MLIGSLLEFFQELLSFSLFCLGYETKVIKIFENSFQLRRVLKKNPLAVWIQLKPFFYVGFSPRKLGINPNVQACHWLSFNSYYSEILSHEHSSSNTYWLLNYVCHPKQGRYKSGYSAISTRLYNVLIIFSTIKSKRSNP